MGRQVAVSALRTPKEGGAERSVADRRHTQAGSSEPNLSLARANVWTHTLILTGELNRRSAHTLEAEIEHLCEEGVTGITVDLRGLTHIDWTGVAVIAFRCNLCKRRGHDFGLIPGSPVIQRAFEQAGLIDALPFQDNDVAGSLVEAHHASERATG